MTIPSQRQQSEILIEALLQLCTIKGVPYYIVNKGGHDGCAILAKVYVGGQGAMLYGQMRDMEGDLNWYSVFGDSVCAESEVDEYIRVEVSNDPDLWALEFELNQFFNPFEKEELIGEPPQV